MTLLGYFNALRELGGSRRIVEDEIRSRLADYAARRRRIVGAETLLADRTRFREPRELTSRVATNQVAETKRRLARTHHHEDSVDVALATNMISVGLDITRLGLMVVLGQPKTAAEYIQTTSRVGRDEARPGLVVTLLNVHRPRDRSHYERFINWHESFYRAVEATSVTPFSPRAVDRGPGPARASSADPAARRLCPHRALRPGRFCRRRDLASRRAPRQGSERRRERRAATQAPSPGHRSFGDLETDCRPERGNPEPPVPGRGQRSPAPTQEPARSGPGPVDPGCPQVQGLLEVT